MGGVTPRGWGQWPEVAVVTRGPGGPAPHTNVRCYHIIRKILIHSFLLTLREAFQPSLYFLPKLLTCMIYDPHSRWRIKRMLLSIIFRSHVIKSLQDASPEPESLKGGPDVTWTMERTQWPSCQGVCLSNFTLRETQWAPVPGVGSVWLWRPFLMIVCPVSLSRDSPLLTPLLLVILRTSWITFILKKRRNRQARINLKKIL